MLERARTVTITALLCLVSSTFLEARAAGGAVPTGFEPTQAPTGYGQNPFLQTINIAVSGAPLASASFSIQPLGGSFTRPLSVTYSASYLTNQQLYNPSTGALSIPVFGLYNAPQNNLFSNIVQFAIQYTDGSAPTIFHETMVTPGFTDPCIGQPGGINLRQNRTRTSDLSYDYMLVKDDCSPFSPEIIDTDGYIRSIGTVNNAGVLASNIFGGYIVSSYPNGNFFGQYVPTGLNITDIKSGGVGQSPSFLGQNGIVFMGDHNIDHGKDGFLVGVTTTNNLPPGLPANSINVGATIVEIGGSLTIERTWDFVKIITAAMQANGATANEIAGFVTAGQNGGAGDWFHQNSSTYHLTNNNGPDELVVSSRENFVIAVDYDDHPDGSPKQIHWILGDTTKAWYKDFTALRRYALQVNPSYLPPIGQHGISFDSSGFLELLSDGQPSLHHSPNNGLSANPYVFKYSLDLSANRTATETYAYNVGVSMSPFCGSVYDVVNSYGYSSLVDFADVPSSPTSYLAELQGLRADSSLVFDMQITPGISTPGSPPNNMNQCNAAWNTVPLDLSNVHY